MTKRIVVLLVLSVLVFGGLAGAKYRQILGLKERYSKPPPPTRVAAVLAEEKTWARSLFAVGSLAAVQDVNVMAEVPGQIAAIHFESGKEVAAGDVLITLDASVDEAELAGLEATRRLTALQLERAEKLQRDRTVSRAQYDEAAARHAEADARVKAKQAYLAKKLIRAPISGTLGIRRIDIGDYLAPGSQVVMLQQLDPMFVDFRIPERFVDRVAKGQRITLKVQSQGERAFEGHVTAVDPAVDAATRMVKVRAKLPNPGHLLKPGMFADVHVDEASSDQRVVVPETAVTYSPYGNSVFVIESKDGGLRITRRQVKTGETRQGRVAVLEGLAAGEQVVAVGQNKLRNDMAVEIAPGALP